MFVIDTDRLIRLRNDSGKTLLSRRDLLLERDGAISCRDPECDRRLAAAVCAMADHRAGVIERRAVPLRSDDRRVAVATLHGLREDGDARRAPVRILLTVFEPAARAGADPALLAEAYGLTAAEARLAALVAAGRRTAHCERLLGVKTSTLRSHLGAIYRKTGANGKADLVRMVLLLSAM